MRTENDDIQSFIIKCRDMDIEELSSNIDEMKKTNDSSTQLQNINVAKKELELKYMEREKQIELLSKSLISSSRLRRWISSVKTIFK